MITGTKPRVESMHAGLECGYIVAYNLDIDMISVGPLITGAHSVDETLHLKTLSPTVEFVQKTVESIARINC